MALFVYIKNVIRFLVRLQLQLQLNEVEIITLVLIFTVSECEVNID